MNNKFKKFLNDLIVAFFAQGISLICSFLLSFLVPKFLGVKEFGYWQLFIFYISFSGISHFGFNDGVFLRSGGKKYNELNLPLIGGQFWLSVIFESIIALSIMNITLFEQDPNRKFVLIMTAIYLVVFNASEMLGHLFQSVNESIKYSISTIINSISLVICVTSLLFFKIQHSEYYIVFYLLTRILSLAYCMHQAHTMIFTKPSPFKKTMNELWKNITIGINLTISYFSGVLIIGCGRFITDSVWGIESFAKLSFALSLNSFVMVFIYQFGMVLFPALKQTNLENIKSIYHLINKGLGVLLLGVLLFYLPFKLVFNLWLPQYSESLRYLSLLLPICVFDAKTELLCNTYLKVLRKEKILLQINLFSLVISLMLSMFFAFVIHSLNFIVVSMVFSIALRNILSEYYLSGIMEIRIWKDISVECCLVIVFTSTTWFLNAEKGFVVYLMLYLFYLFLSKDQINQLMNNAKKMLKTSN
ncbi:MAG: hypothetical protein K0S80_5292 [Neobacillus sp.]|nr:hypothetical protein [Neobacillus sp.]